MDYEDMENEQFRGDEIFRKLEDMSQLPPIAALIKLIEADVEDNCFLEEFGELMQQTLLTHSLLFNFTMAPTGEISEVQRQMLATAIGNTMVKSSCLIERAQNIFGDASTADEGDFES